MGGKVRRKETQKEESKSAEYSGKGAAEFPRRKKNCVFGFELKRT